MRLQFSLAHSGKHRPAHSAPLKPRGHGMQELPKYPSLHADVTIVHIVTGAKKF